MEIIFEMSEDELKDMLDEAEVKSKGEPEEILQKEFRVYSEDVKVFVEVS